MRSPYPLIALIAFYLYFVLKLGPKLMQNREPFELTRVLIFYNAYQVVFSLCLCLQAIRIDDIWGYVFRTSCSSPSNNNLRELVNIHLLIRINWSRISLPLLSAYQLHMVVPIFQDCGTFGHCVFRFEEEAVASYLFTRVSSLNNGTLHMGLPQIYSR